LIGRAAAESVAHDRSVRIEDGELAQQFLRFPESVGRREDGVSTNGPCDRGDELEYRLMRNTDRICLDSTAENFGGDSLLIGKPAIEAVNLYVGSTSAAWI
jgi:hypothetical protein